MKGESMLYVAKHDIMVMRRRRKGESLPPPLPPKLLRAGFMAKGATFRQREGEEQRRGEGRGKERVLVRQMTEFEMEERNIFKKPSISFETGENDNQISLKINCR
jgi:hypothetical protein